MPLQLAGRGHQETARAITSRIRCAGAGFQIAGQADADLLQGVAPAGHGYAIVSKVRVGFNKGILHHPGG